MTQSGGDARRCCFAPRAALRVQSVGTMQRGSLAPEGLGGLDERGLKVRAVAYLPADPNGGDRKVLDPGVALVLVAAHVEGIGASREHVG